MEAVVILGFLVIFVGAMGTLLAAFSTSLWWGLGCLLVGPVSLLFLIFHWDVAKNPFFLQLVGFAIVLLGGGLK